MTDLPRLIDRLKETFDPGGMLPEDCSEWAAEHDQAIEDVSARLQQLETEKAELENCVRATKIACEQEKLASTQLSAALAETRDALHQLTEAFERRLGEFEITPDALNKAKELLSRRDTPGSSNAIVSQPPLGDTSTDR